MDGFSIGLLQDLTPGAVLLLVVVLVLWGKLVPVRQVEKDERRYEASLARADEVIKIQSQTILELTVAANNSLNVAARTVTPPEGGDS